MRGRVARWAAREVATGLVAPYTNPVAATVGAVMSGHIAEDRFRRGARGVRDAYAGAPIMGGEWSHGGDDRAAALAQIGADFAAFQANLVEVGGNGCAAAIALATELAPTLAEWHNFVARMASSPLAAYVASWKVYERWHERLRQARQTAGSRGVILTSPEPAALPKTIWQRGNDGTGSTFDTWISLGRKIFFGTLAVAGAVGLYSSIRKVRTDVRRLAQGSSKTS